MAVEDFTAAKVLQFPATPQARTSGLPHSLDRRAGSNSVVATSAVPPPAALTEDELQDRAAWYWQLLLAGVITHEEADRAVTEMERRAGKTRNHCESCHRRAGVVVDYGFLLCGTCVNGGRRG